MEGHGSSLALGNAGSLHTVSQGLVCPLPKPEAVTNVQQKETTLLGTGMTQSRHPTACMATSISAPSWEATA